MRVRRDLQGAKNTETDIGTAIVAAFVSSATVRIGTALDDAVGFICIRTGRRCGEHFISRWTVTWLLAKATLGMTTSFSGIVTRDKLEVSKVARKKGRGV